MEYEFTVKFKIAADVAEADQLVERLGQAGCTDALVGVGQPGRIALDFIREADSADAAIVSAIADVKKAIPDAKLIEVSPDLVGLTEVADIVGVTRQNMRKLMLSHATSFPAPVHEGSSALWHLAHMLQWLGEREAYRIEQSILDVARTAMHINLAKEVRQLKLRVRRELQALLV